MKNAIQQQPCKGRHLILVDSANCGFHTKGCESQQYFYFSRNPRISCWGGRMVQAVACRAALYGFNSHPQLLGDTFSTLHLFTLREQFSAPGTNVLKGKKHQCFVSSFYGGKGFLSMIKDVI